MLTLLLASVLVFAPVTAPATKPDVESDLRRIIATLQQQLAELKDTNAKLQDDVALAYQRLEEANAKIRSLEPKTERPGDFQIGMTIDEAKLIARQYRFKMTSEETANGRRDVWINTIRTNPRELIFENGKLTNIVKGNEPK